MTDTKAHGASKDDSPEGRVFRPGSFTELAEAVDVAFDYRGDVTLELSSGEILSCYLFNREPSGGDSCVEVFTENEAAPRVISYKQISSISFTGQDTASGKSWEAWVAKKESQRLAEALQIAEDARARGHL
ncbi:hypothetical protein YTPLAS18_08330 [Nitrospira sp.]|nr:hypothetical protein YTPLAS18_08330 [Nitrospira sp.]